MAKAVNSLISKQHTHHLEERESTMKKETAIPHPLKVADDLSANAWMNWAEKQQKK
jgi:hypothetical protein